MVVYAKTGLPVDHVPPDRGGAGLVVLPPSRWRSEAPTFPHFHPAGVVGRWLPFSVVLRPKRTQGPDSWAMPVIQGTVGSAGHKPSDGLEKMSRCMLTRRGSTVLPV